jgi:hypothetical protein
MRSRKPRSLVVVAVIAVAGLIAGAAPSMARGARVSRVHSVGTFIFTDADPQTYVADVGEITAVGDASISLIRRDDVTVTLAASADTCTHVDGLPATLQNLVIGQDVTVVSDGTGTQALSIRAGHPKIKPGEPGCGLLGGAVHGDIADTMSDGTARERAWDRGGITGLAPGWIRILRPDDVIVVSHPTRDTRVIGVSSYWRLRLGERVSIMSIKQENPQGGVTLLAARIHVHRR